MAITEVENEPETVDTRKKSNVGSVSQPKLKDHDRCRHKRNYDGHVVVYSFSSRRKNIGQQKKILEDSMCRCKNSRQLSQTYHLMRTKIESDIAVIRGTQNQRKMNYMLNF
ncbi:uncharacterized protein LOC123313498 [Coccinella septempunctata]|uniref:uncharacterized protein LOC123313498 n=1 Tax=Coccinella septempunctata TaxID=41139 RepID=UPI001D089D7D|nr:uncharacterized protein LOC123313498 [Coccinella septempunctata]